MYRQKHLIIIIVVKKDSLENALHYTKGFSVKKSYCSYFGYANESVFSMDNILGVILLLRISTESAVV